MDIVSTRKAWWLYSFIRLGLFGIAFVVIWLLSNIVWFAAICAALISMAISIIALDPLRQKAAEGLQAWKDRDTTEDTEFEDEVIDEDPTVLDMSPATESDPEEPPTNR